MQAKKKISVVLVMILLLGTLSGCKDDKKAQVQEKDLSPITVQAAEFAPYTEVAVDEQPNLQPYTVASDLSNVENASRFKFSAPVQKRLVQNGFAVVPDKYSEYYMLYEANRYDSVPNLVTTDSMLHNYHLFFEHLLKTVEEEKLLPELKKLNQGMVQASQEQYEALKNTAWENAARRNLAFFAAGRQIIDPQAAVPAMVQKEVRAELLLIQNHKQTAVSPIMSMGSQPDELESLKEDYTQYIPRGHYTRSESLQSYFQAMMWYGRMTFRLKNEDETRSAVLMTMALQNEANNSSWNKIYSTTEFFAGRSDDPGYAEYSALLARCLVPAATLKRWRQRINAVIHEAGSRIKGPAINSVPIFDATIQPDRERKSRVRFMDRLHPGCGIFQAWSDREVGKPAGRTPAAPNGLDIPAAMGSVSPKILKDMGETDYAIIHKI
jgi:hypothetical protein